MGGLCSKPSQDLQRGDTDTPLPQDGQPKRQSIVANIFSGINLGRNSAIFTRTPFQGKANDFDDEKQHEVKNGIAQLFTELETMPAYLIDNDIKEEEDGQYFSEIYEKCGFLNMTQLEKDGLIHVVREGLYINPNTVDQKNVDDKTI